MEDMVGGTLLVIREAVGEVQPCRLCVGEVKLIVHLIIRGGIRQLVGQRQTAGTVLVEEPLVVDAAVEGGTSHLHIGSGTIGIAVAIQSATHIGGAIAVVLHTEGRDTCCQT